MKIGKYVVPLTLGLAGLSMACSNGNGNSNNVKPTNTYEPTAVVRTVQPTVGPTAELDYCNPEVVAQIYGERPLSLTEADAFNVSFNKLDRTWSTEVNYRGGPAIYRRFGQFTPEIYGSMVTYVNDQLVGRNVLDENIDFFTIRVADNKITVSQNPNGDGTVIPFNELPNGFDAKVIAQRTSSPFYCDIV